MSLQLLAPFKLNLFLEVFRRRSDGYHELVSVMETLDLGDGISLESAPTLDVRVDRPDIPGGEDNLVARIIRAAEAQLHHPLPARIQIHKEVPPGSGLGAGSSDAVTALGGVLALHGLQVSRGELGTIAASVGSDTPFFLSGGLALCRGRGERVEPLPPGPLRHYVLVTGAPPASTREVFRALVPPNSPRSEVPFLAALQAGKFQPFNRLQEAAFARYPALASLALELKARSGSAPSLSGSGSAFYFPCANAHEAAALAACLTIPPLLARPARSLRAAR